MLTLRCSKFFGKPGGAQPTPTQQTKLSFSPKLDDKSKKQEAVKREDDGDGKPEEKKGETSTQGSPSSASAKKNSEAVSGECVG